MGTSNDDSGISLPSGVTLQAIDGESMLTPTTMSNNYYSRNGFTFATGSNPSYPTVNWDSPSFFPITDFFALGPQTDLAPCIDLGINVSMATFSGVSSFTSSLVSNNFQCIGGDVTLGDWTVGFHLDEPGAPSDIQTDINNNTAGNWAGRFYDVAFTINQIVGGDLGGTPMASVLSHNFFSASGGGSRSIDTSAIDIYWFAGSGDTTVNPGLMGVLHQPMQFTATGFTADQMKRGSHYGNMIDVYRSWTNGTNSGTAGGDGMIGTSGATGRIPVTAFIENYNGNFNEASTIINPPELNWAIWSTLIHGARQINYFVYTNENQGGGGITTQGFHTDIYSGQSISIYNQVKATNALVKSLAPVLNSPFATGFLTALSPSGYIFPTPASSWLNGGIEACVKWDGSHFYIFATTRNGESSGSVSATFTVARGTTATVINESRSISISAGQFTDTFANAWTVHIYRIDP